MLKLAFFETGRRHDHVIEQFDGLEIDRVPICKVKSLNLMYYDILFIPSFSNQDILSNISERLKIFLRYGGIIIALGALQDKTQWMPYCTYNLPFLKEIEFKNIDQRQSKIVFDKLSLNQNDFRFHDVFMTHGFFKCNEDICFPLITGTDEQSLVMAILEPKGAAGKVLFTTLDPDFHAISGYQRECK